MDYDVDLWSVVAGDVDDLPTVWRLYSHRPLMEEDYNYFELTMEKSKKQELLFDPTAFPMKLTKKALYLQEGDELVRYL